MAKTTEKTASRQLTFKFERGTPGALRYQEVDADGHPLGMDAATIGTLYLRRDKVDGEPPAVKVTLELI